MFNKIKEYIFHKDKIMRSNRHMLIVIIITAILSLIAAFNLSIDAVELAKNPNTHLNCSINVVINCATVANSKYASLFGFPNSFIGMMVEPIFIVIAIAMLMGTKFSKKFMFATEISAICALIFAFGLFFISSFIIHVLCPWCMLVFISTIIMFFAISRYNIRENNLFLSSKLEKRSNNYIDKDYDKLTLAIIIVIILAFIIINYGSALFA